MFVAVKVIVLYTIGLSFMTQRLQQGLGGGAKTVVTETRTYLTTTGKNVTYTNTTVVVVPVSNHTALADRRGVSLLSVTSLIAAEVGGTLALMLRAGPSHPRDSSKGPAGAGGMKLK
jgi:hypothetical protein